MLCQEVRARLQDMIEGRLPDATLCAIQAHLDSCRSCSSEYQVWRMLWRALSGLPLCEHPPDLRPAIMSRLPGREAWPKRLVAIFILAGLSSLAGLVPWTGRLQADNRILAAVLWAIAGVTSVISVWMAVERGDRPSQQEE